jgi:hypothetical protein
MKANSSRDVALMMHTHLLHPVAFARDISSSIRYNTLAGLVDFPLMKLDHKLRHKNYSEGADAALWHRKNAPSRPYKMMDVDSDGKMYVSVLYFHTTFKLKTRPPPFSFDLREAVKRQIVFARKITSMYPYDPVPEGLLARSQQRYTKFMNLIRTTGNPAIVPTLDIDLFWHTHQLFASTYIPWCASHIGHPINHDDTVGEGELATGLEDTATAWYAAYSEDYLNMSSGSEPDTNTPEEPQEPITADKTPPPGLTGAQLALWNFDVTIQNLHELLSHDLNTQRVHLKSYDDQVSALPPAPSLSSSEAEGGGGSFMKRVFKVATKDMGSRGKLLSNQKSQAASINLRIQRHREDREGWGRRRWPLLVAARGWGDLRVTEGQWVRPFQGSTSLDFPIYAATWYDRRDLGYYNYITGGKNHNGGIDGGGLRVGGGMCAGRFDGGNCVAVVYRDSDNNAGGGGG